MSARATDLDVEVVMHALMFPIHILSLQRLQTTLKTTLYIRADVSHVSWNINHMCSMLKKYAQLHLNAHQMRIFADGV